jgi:hypothetical protein
MTTETEIDTDAAESWLQTTADGHPGNCPATGLRLRADDSGIAFDESQCNRWQKYGHDRLYFGGGFDGYIDLESGAVEGDTPVDEVEVTDGRVVYIADTVDERTPVASREV